MNSIEEEAAEIDDGRPDQSKSPEGIVVNQLNMAEIRKQHDELQEKINEQKQKFIEEGLRKHRKSSL